MDPPEPRLTARDRLWTLMRARALWPLPALLLLMALLPFLPEEAWRAPYTTRRTLSRAELAMVLSGVGCALYWLVLVLGGKGLLYTPRSWAMREPSEGEQALAEAGLRLLCLTLTYLGPALLIWGH
ncbi:MAG TPA: hypothetical protein VFZ61_27720 [Polyangiales bacterium]